MDNKTYNDLMDMLNSLSRFYYKNKKKLKNPIKAYHFLESFSSIMLMYSRNNNTPIIRTHRLKMLFDNFFRLKEIEVKEE